MTRKYKIMIWQVCIFEDSFNIKYNIFSVGSVIARQQWKPAWCFQYVIAVTADADIATIWIGKQSADSVIVQVI